MTKKETKNNYDIDDVQSNLRKSFSILTEKNPKISKLIEDHKGHAIIDCKSLIGNPGVGNKFDSLNAKEQQRLQDIVDSIRIHLAVLEETSINTNKAVNQVRKDVVSTRDDAKNNYKSNLKRLGEMKHEIASIRSDLARVKTTQKIIWVFVSATILGIIGQMIGLGFWIIKSLIESGVFG
jgi:hypothetical protein